MSPKPSHLSSVSTYGGTRRHQRSVPNYLTAQHPIAADGTEEAKDLSKKVTTTNVIEEMDTQIMQKMMN